jgi:pimeloyl-ACP methyl ester carboxylesterase
LFVHGFNNSWKSAEVVWGGTLEQLWRRQADPKSVVLFYWPGDYSRWQVRSAMNYPQTVPIAEETAQLLAEYLHRTTKDRKIPLHLSFVAHSLGSLVVLETLKLLRSYGSNVTVGDVLLMAAAVPEGFCERGQDYGEPFSNSTREEVLYSGDDTILKYFFQVGQLIADRFPEEQRRAVGRYGGPSAGEEGRWKANSHKDGYGHGDYWKKPGSIAKIARIVNSQSSPSVQGPDGQQQDRRSPLRKDSLPVDDSLERNRHNPPEATIGLFTRP